MSLSNASDKDSYYLSFGYSNNQGVIENPDRNDILDVLMLISKLKLG